MTWLKYITIHPRIKIELQYIRNTYEYIPKLQLHQHSLLTRKVFSWHNLSTQVFFYVSFGSSSIPHHLHIQVISIFKSYSSSSHLHLDLDHHLIWIIITGCRSSLDLNHHCWIIITRSGSSLDLDHHCWIIITGAISWFFSSQEFLQSQPFSC